MWSGPCWQRGESQPWFLPTALNGEQTLGPLRKARSESWAAGVGAAASGRFHRWVPVWPSLRTTVPHYLCGTVYFWRTTASHSHGVGEEGLLAAVAYWARRADQQSCKPFPVLQFWKIKRALVSYLSIKQNLSEPRYLLQKHSGQWSFLGFTTPLNWSLIQGSWSEPQCEQRSPLNHQWQRWLYPGRADRAAFCPWEVSLPSTGRHLATLKC